MRLLQILAHPALFRQPHLGGPLPHAARPILSVVDTLGGALNLPDWFPSAALALLIVGLPIVLATAFIPGDEVVELRHGGSHDASRQEAIM